MYLDDVSSIFWIIDNDHFYCPGKAAQWFILCPHLMAVPSGTTSCWDAVKVEVPSHKGRTAMFHGIFWPQRLRQVQVQPYLSLATCKNFTHVQALPYCLGKKKKPVYASNHSNGQQ